VGADSGGDRGVASRSVEDQEATSRETVSGEFSLLKRGSNKLRARRDKLL